jgi:hypothetical protein
MEYWGGSIYQAGMGYVPYIQCMTLDHIGSQFGLYEEDFDPAGG